MQSVPRPRLNSIIGIESLRRYWRKVWILFYVSHHEHGEGCDYPANDDDGRIVSGVVKQRDGDRDRQPGDDISIETKKERRQPNKQDHHSHRIHLEMAVMAELHHASRSG